MEATGKTKTQILNLLDEEYHRWEELLSGLSEAQITAPQLPAGLSIKDVVAHLWAWQTLSVARVEAALHDGKPQVPTWAEGLNPDAEEDLEAINARIHDTNREKPWPKVSQDWRAGFQRFLEAAQQIPEKDLLEPGRYPWLGEYPLSAVLAGSYDHHHEEHLEPLLEWLRQKSIIP